jgi:hypothetical protein
MRPLMIYCDGGFGNRFNALVSGLVMSATLGLRPQVVWPVNNWCGAPFGSLFENDLPVVDRELASFMPERAQYQYLIVEDRLGLADVWVSPLRLPHWDAVRALVAQSDQPVFYYTALIPGFIDATAVLSQVRTLRLRAELVARSDAFLNAHQIGALHGDFFGVQIRKTDFGANGADDDNLFDLISQRPQLRFFVCSDDKEVERRFGALPHVVIYPKRAHVEKRVDGQWTTTTADYSGRLYPCNVNRSADSVEDALVDLLILSRSQIIKTSNSTFLNTALLLQQAAALAAQMRSQAASSRPTHAPA